MYTDDTICDFGKKYTGTRLKDIPTSYLKWFAQSIKDSKDRGAFTLKEKNIVDYVEQRATTFINSHTFNSGEKITTITNYVTDILTDNFSALNMLEGYRLTKRTLKITIEEVE